MKFIGLFNTCILTLVQKTIKWFFSKIIFSKGANFEIGECGKTQMCRSWGQENLRISFFLDDNWTFGSERNSNINLNGMWFEQDGATPQFANETIPLLKTKLTIELFLEIVMLIWNKQLYITVDYFLWKNVKSQVSKYNPYWISELMEESKYNLWDRTTIMLNCHWNV